MKAVKKFANQLVAAGSGPGNYPLLRKHPSWLYVLLLLAGVGVTAASLLYHFRAEYRRTMAHWEARQSSIAHTRAQLISAWLEERRADGEIIASYPALQKHLSGSGVSGRRVALGHLESVLQAFAENGYSGVMVLDRNGVVVARAGKCGGFGSQAPVIARTVAVEGKFRVDVLAGDAAEDLFSFSVPVYSRIGGAPSTGPQTPAGVVMMFGSHAQTLFRLLAIESVPTRTSETVVMVRQGDEAVFISRLRHSRPDWGPVRRPLRDPGFAARYALEGREVFGEFNDYTGVRVLAATRWIPLTGWGVVSKIDRDEALDQFERETKEEALAAGVFLSVFAGLVFGYRRHALTSILAEEGHKFWSLLESAPDAMIITDQDGSILLVNAATERLFGYASAELIGQGIEALVPEFVAVSLRTETARHLPRTSDHVPVEIRCRRKDGSERPVEVNSSPIETKSGILISVAMRDITERKRAEEALRENHERLKKVLEIENVGVMFWDMYSGCMTDANDTFLSLMGYSRREVEARELTWQKLTPPEYLEVSRREVQKFLMTGRVGPYEKEYFHKDGTRQWFVFAGTSIGNNACVEFCVDISARKKAEAALQASEAQFRTLANAIPQLCWMAKPDGWIFWYNARWYEYTGKTPEQMEGWGWKSVHDPEELPKVLDRWQASIATGEPFDMVFPLRGADGVFRPFLTRVMPLRDENGNVAGWFGTNTDISEQRRTEQALRESEARLRLALEAANSGTWEWDLKTNQNTWSDELWKLYGLQPHSCDPSYEAWLKAVHPGDRAKVEETVQDASKMGRELNAEWRVCESNGTERWLMSRGRPLRDADGQPIRFIGIVMDITARKRAEEAARQSEMQYRGLFEHMHEGLAYCKMVFENGEPRDFIYLAVNDAFETLTGLKDVAGKRVTEVIPGVQQTDLELLGIYARVAQTGVPEKFEIYLQALAMWFSISVYSPERGFFVAIFDVITERKRAEEALQKSRMLLERLFEFAPDAILATDQDGGITQANLNAEKSFGYSRSELLGQPIELLIPERHRAAHRAHREGYCNTPASRPMGKGLDLWGRCKDGRTFPVDVQLNSIQTEEGLLVLSVVRDITERKRAEEQIRQLNAELEQRVLERTAQLAASNRELEAFSYSVSHDLRAPLRGIDGFSLALLEDYAEKLDDQAKDYLSRVRAATLKMGQLIEDLLSFSRITRAELRRGDIDLTALAKDAISEIRNSEPQRETAVVIQSGLRAQGDAHLVGVALRNLLANAWKFSSRQPQARVEIGVESQDGRTIYYVRDNGVGFDMTYAHKLFAPFQRLHANTDFPGSGVGLATVQRIIRKHGGDVWAESASGKGATFYFTLEPSASVQAQPG